MSSTWEKYTCMCFVATSFLAEKPSGARERLFVPLYVLSLMSQGLTAS
jgi:hypothetical protein